MIKFLELTEVNESVVYNYSQPLSQIQGGLYSSPTSPYYGAVGNYSSSPTQSSSTLSTNSVLIRPENIKMIRELTTGNAKSQINLDNGIFITVLQTPDMIKKQLHSIEFNDKMDKILDK